jgi:hypothetical protein
MLARQIPLLSDCEILPACGRGEVSEQAALSPLPEAGLWKNKKGKAPFLQIFYMQTEWYSCVVSKNKVVEAEYFRISIEIKIQIFFGELQS